MSLPYFRRFAVTLAAAFVLSNCGKEEKAAEGPAPIEVAAIKLKKSDLPVSMEFVGQTKGAVDAEIRARVEGPVTSMHFDEGKEVKEGQLLYTIDTAPYDAKVAEAQGKVAEAEAVWVKAKSDLDRIRPLVKMKAMAERDLDRAVAQEGTGKASVDAAKANLDSAKIELGYCKISSPVTGIIGQTKAKVGEFVGRPPNPIVLNTVSSLDPIRVLFSITENDYLFFMRLKQKQLDAGETAAKRQLHLVLADGQEYSELGEVISLDRAVDAATGSLPVEAAFPNKHQLIRPGQFARIRAIAETLNGVIVVPKKALREMQGQYQAFVIGGDNTVQPKNVTLGVAVGDQQVVATGLAENDIVAVEGLQRLKAGTAVTAKLAG